MVISRLSMLVAAALSAVGLIATFTDHVGTEGREIGKGASRAAEVARAEQLLRGSSTQVDGFKVPPAEDAPFLATLTDRDGVRVRYCAAFPGKVAGESPHYSAPGEAALTDGSARVAMLAFLNESKVAAPDALSGRFEQACENLDALVLAAPGQTPDPATNEIDAARKIIFLTQADLAGAAASGSEAYLPAAASLSSLAGLPLDVEKNTLTYDPATKSLARFDGSTWAPLSGSLGLAGAPLLSCPVHMAAIPPTLLESGYRVPAFCVDKYLQAQYRGALRPWVPPYSAYFVPQWWLTAPQADEACRTGKGGGGRLISALQFQAIALLATAIPENWTGGAVGAGKFIAGAHPGSKPPPSADVPPAGEVGLLPSVPANYGVHTMTANPASAAAGYLPFVAEGYPVGYFDGDDARAMRAHAYIRPDLSEAIWHTGQLQLTRTRYPTRAVGTGVAPPLYATWSSQDEIAMATMASRFPELRPPAAVRGGATHAFVAWQTTLLTDGAASQPVIAKASLVSTVVSNKPSATLSYRCTWTPTPEGQGRE